MSFNLEKIVHQANLIGPVAELSHEDISMLVVNLREIPDFPKEGKKTHSLPFVPESIQDRKIHGIPYRVYLDKVVELPDGE